MQSTATPFVDQGPAPTRMGDGSPVPTKASRAFKLPKLTFLFFTLSLVVPCACTSDNVRPSVKLQHWSCTEGGYSTGPMTSAEDIGPFDCRIAARATATTPPWTTTMCAINVDADDDFFAPPSFWSNDADADSVLVCTWPMGAVYPMEYAMGDGIASPEEPILLPATAGASRQVPPTVETTTVRIIEDGMNYEDANESNESTEQPPTASSDADHPVSALMLPSIDDTDRVVDYGTELRTCLLPVHEPPVTPGDEEEEEEEEEDDDEIQAHEDAMVCSCHSPEAHFKPRRPTIYQQIGAIRRLLMPRPRTSDLTPTFPSGVLYEEPPTMPIPLPFWHPTRMPYVVRRSLLVCASPKIVSIGEIAGVEAQSDPINLFSVRTHSRNFLDELLPGTRVEQCFYERRPPKPASWMNAHIWVIRRVFPSRFRTSSTTPLTAPNEHFPEPFASPVIFPLWSNEHLRTIPPLIAPSPRVLRLEDLRNVAWSSEPLDVRSVRRALSKLAADVESSMRNGVTAAKHQLLDECPLDLTNTNRSLALPVPENSALPRDDVAMPELAAKLDLSLINGASPDSTRHRNELATSISILNMFFASVAAVALVYAMHLQLKIAEFKAATTATRQAASLATIRASLALMELGAVHTRTTRARRERACRRLRSANRSVESVLISVDVAVAKNSRRGALRRLRPRSARLSAVAPLLKRDSLAISPAKRPVSARQTARKSADHLGAPKAAAWDAVL